VVRARWGGIPTSHREPGPTRWLQPISVSHSRSQDCNSLGSRETASLLMHLRPSTGRHDCTRACLARRGDPTEFRPTPTRVPQLCHVVARRETRSWPLLEHHQERHDSKQLIKALLNISSGWQLNCSKSTAVSNSESRIAICAQNAIIATIKVFFNIKGPLLFL